MAPRNSKTSFFAPWSPTIASRRALDSPQHRPRRPHREAEGPKKPPRTSFRYRRLSVPNDFGQKIHQEKTARGIAEAFPRRHWGCRVQCFSIVSPLDDLLLLLLLLLLFLLCPLRLLHYHYKTKAKTKAKARTKIKTKNEIRTRSMSKTKP